MYSTHLKVSLKYREAQLEIIHFRNRSKMKKKEAKQTHI